MINENITPAFMRNVKMEELIRMRDELLELLCSVEQREGFGRWHIPETNDPCESYPDLEYSRISDELAEIMNALADKWRNLVIFTTDEFNTTKNRNTCLFILEEIKKVPKITREELCKRINGQVDGALDYLIEKDCISYRRTKEYDFWKILYDQI